MSDEKEIKQQTPEATKVESSPALTQPELDNVVGGTIVKKADKASTTLYKQCCSGQHFQTVTIE